MIQASNKYGFEVIESTIPEDDWSVDLANKTKKFLAELDPKVKETINNNVDTIMNLIYNNEDKNILVNNMENSNTNKEIGHVDMSTGKWVDGKHSNIQEQSVNEAVIENVDNKTLANIVADKAGYEFAQFILVKPLEKIKVYKTLTVPEDSGEKDEEGNAIMQMTIKQIETESLFRKGVVISLPTSLEATEYKLSGMTISVGDTIVYPEKRSMDFDLFKDTALVAGYEVIAKEN